MIFFQRNHFPSLIRCTKSVTEINNIDVTTIFDLLNTPVRPSRIGHTYKKRIVSVVVRQFSFYVLYMICLCPATIRQRALLTGNVR